MAAGASDDEETLIFTNLFTLTPGGRTLNIM